MARGLMAKLAAEERAELEKTGAGTQVGNLFIVRGQSRNPKYPVHLRIWRGKQAKPFYNYILSEDRVDREIEKQIEADREIEKYRANRKAAGKSEREKVADSLVVGTLLHGSWGYEQTNCELYQVTGRPSRYKVEVRSIGYEVVGNGYSHGMTENRRPKKDDFHGEPRVLTIGPNGYIKLHDHCSLSPTSESETHYASWYA